MTLSFPAPMPRQLPPRLLSLMLGALSVFGFAPFYLFQMPILALAGLIYLTRNHTPAESFLRGWLFGLGWFLAGVSWVYVSMHDIGGLVMPAAALLTVLFAAFLALFPAIALGLATRLAEPGSVRMFWLMPACWALLEWLRGSFLTGFPWQALGYSQAPYSPLAAYAPILGVYGVSWLAALTAGALARWQAKPMLVAVLIWLGGLGLGGVTWTQPVGQPVSVSLMQGNVPQDLKFRPEKMVDTLRLYRDLVLDSESQLVVLPETALPLFLDNVPQDYLDLLVSHVRSQGGHLLVGVPEREIGSTYFNSVVAMGEGPDQRYRKSHLVPFGEFVPPGFKWFVDAMEIPLSSFTPGQRGQAPLTIGDQRVAINLCYEDVFGEELLHALPDATLMVNVSNDAWFGDSFAPWQHLQIAQMRALETGRWWLKDNNTGITAVIDARGQVVTHLEPFMTANLHSLAQGMTGSTPYSRWGNTVFAALAGLALLVGWRRQIALQRRP